MEGPPNIPKNLSILFRHISCPMEGLAKAPIQPPSKLKKLPEGWNPIGQEAFIQHQNYEKALTIAISPQSQPECHRAHNLFNKFNLFRQEMLHIKLHEHKRADQHRKDG